MKTPDEIKKELKRCENDAHCDSCLIAFHCQLEDDALALIEQLEREKQALIYDIRNYGFHLCLTCANSKGKYECAKLGTNGLDDTDDGETVIMRCAQYEWRGLKEEKNENT